MPRHPDYSHYKIAVCSHMRLVVYACEPIPGKWNYDGTEQMMRTGWFHVSPSGMLEGMAPPCEASIHRFEIEWPENATSLNHMLMKERRDDKRQVTPDDKNVAEGWSGYA